MYLGPRTSAMLKDPLLETSTEWINTTHHDTRFPIFCSWKDMKDWKAPHTHIIICIYRDWPLPIFIIWVCMTRMYTLNYSHALGKMMNHHPPQVFFFPWLFPIFSCKPMCSSGWITTSHGDDSHHLPHHSRIPSRREVMIKLIQMYWFISMQSLSQPPVASWFGLPVPKSFWAKKRTGVIDICSLPILDTLLEKSLVGQL